MFLFTHGLCTFRNPPRTIMVKERTRPGALWSKRIALWVKGVKMCGPCHATWGLNVNTQKERNITQGTKIHHDVLLICRA